MTAAPRQPGDVGRGRRSFFHILLSVAREPAVIKVNTAISCLKKQFLHNALNIINIVLI